MNFSYWEYKTWLSNIDFTIVGSGIVGLNCALRLKERFPAAKILILEKGILPQGASTKNAGFACYGSISEILSDLKNHTEQEVINLVQNRWDGIQLLRKSLGEDKIGFENHGGHEIFLQKEGQKFENCVQSLGYINNLLEPVFGQGAFKILDNKFNFKNVCKSYISNLQEGQIDTGLMMASLISEVQKKGVIILNSIEVEEINELNMGVAIKTSSFDFKSKNVFVATNGFASTLINEEVKPARAQVVVTSPIEGLQLKGSFHLEEGFYYFRNIENRILLGGGRNLDFDQEETTEFGCTPTIQNKLEDLLNEIILPKTSFNIEHRWSGIMGVGKQKRPILKQLSNHVFCGVRLGGMGIAIGSHVGAQLADLLPN